MTETGHATHYRAHQLSMGALAATAFFASAPGQSFLIAVFVDDMLQGTGLDQNHILRGLATGAILAFLALATLRTFGQGSFPLLGTLLVARSFERRRGQAMAGATLGLTSASILLPPAVAALVVVIGWRHAYQSLGLLLLILVAPLAMCIKDGPPRRTVSADDRPAVSYPRAARSLRRGRFTVPTRERQLASRPCE